MEQNKNEKFPHVSWKYHYGYQKNAEFYADFKFVDADLNKGPPKKLEPKNYANFEFFRFCPFFRGFLLLTFVRSISESRHQRIWNQHKILRFFDTHNDIFKKKIFWVIIALFAFFKCKCEKNCTFSNILQKVKSYFFANIYHSQCDSYWNFKKSIKLKPPIAGPHWRILAISWQDFLSMLAPYLAWRKLIIYMNLNICIQN